MRRSRIEPMHLLFAALGGAVLLFIAAPLAGMFLNVGKAEISEAAADPEVAASVWLTLGASMLATCLLYTSPSPRD